MSFHQAFHHKETEKRNPDQIVKILNRRTENGTTEEVGHCDPERELRTQTA
tara:strand:- start:455 stop:607 length:153 start_codon:yes stop_codon:yes gene_type:complete